MQGFSHLFTPRDPETNFVRAPKSVDDTLAKSCAKRRGVVSEGGDEGEELTERSERLEQKDERG